MKSWKIKTISALLLITVLTIGVLNNGIKSEVKTSSSLILSDIKLPEPETVGGMPIMQVFKNRKTDRLFSSDPVPDKMLSNLLWAANGINRPDGHRTAPTALNKQEIDIYVILPAGSYLYMPKDNLLKQIPSTVKPHVPLTLVYVGDLNKQKEEYAMIDSGFIGQNVYLFCAANKLNTVFKGSINREELAKDLGLNSNQKVLFTQDIGFPPKN